MITNSLRDQRFLIVGLVRNGEKTIVNEITHLANVFKNFSRLSWFIIESDSNDQTLEKLDILTRDIPNFSYKSAGTLAKLMPSRLVRLAHCRNLYLDELLNNPQFQGTEYLVVADLDNMNPLLTEEAILSCWDKEGWGGCCANQRGPYYDLGALRHPDWMPNDCWRHYKFLIQQGKSEDEAMSAAVHANMVTIAENADWIEVDSAFGGIAVYPTKVLGNARYKGYDKEGRDAVDHIGFHEGIRENGYKIFINPKLINTSFNEHTRDLLESRQLRKKIKAFFRLCNPLKLIPFLLVKVKKIKAQTIFYADP
jgi:hypothetical protein